MMVDS